MNMIKSQHIQISAMEVNPIALHQIVLPQKLILVMLLLLSGAFFQVDAQVKNDNPSQTKPSEPARRSQTYKQEGVTVEFSIEPISPKNNKNTGGLIAGTEALLRFKFIDSNGGNALNNLRPAAWIDRRDTGQVPDARECREKIQAFLQPSFNKRPNIDLNAYFILALNHEANISVIDPLSGFGGSKLYTLVPLRSSGEDWVLSADKKRLYVSMPLVGEVAVIDTTTWKVLTNIGAGMQPTRLALQHDGRYLWVGNDTSEDTVSGITVIDTETLKVAAQFKTGAGHHEIAFAADDSFAFVTNKQSGTLSVIDGRTLTRLTDIKVGTLPVALAFSPLSNAIYVVTEGDGLIVVVDASRREILTRIKAEPGLRSVRIVPDGRFGMAVNPVTNKAYIFDISANRLIHAVSVGPAADQITFTEQFAYVRSGGSEFVTMIKITDLDKEAEVAVTRFAAGQKAPKESPASSYADAVVTAPGTGSVLVANPADKMIYYYTEGMAAPMGSFQNYRRDPKALLVLYNGLVETARGIHTTTIRLPAPGQYNVALLVDSPRLVNCFEFTVAENPELSKEAVVAIKVEPLIVNPTPRVGESYNLRFKVTDANSGLPKSNLQDMGVLVFLAPGLWQQREWAKSQGDGVYEMSFIPPKAGAYYIHFHCPSLGVRLNHIYPVSLQAIKK
jgi:YVTN family beta-propeller protein